MISFSFIFQLLGHGSLGLMVGKVQITQKKGLIEPCVINNEFICGQLLNASLPLGIGVTISPLCWSEVKVGILANVYCSPQL